MRPGQKKNEKRRQREKQKHKKQREKDEGERKKRRVGGEDGKMRAVDERRGGGGRSGERSKRGVQTAAVMVLHT